MRTVIRTTVLAFAPAKGLTNIVVGTAGVMARAVAVVGITAVEEITAVVEITAVMVVIVERTVVVALMMATVPTIRT